MTVGRTLIGSLIAMAMTFAAGSAGSFSSGGEFRSQGSGPMAEATRAMNAEKFAQAIPILESIVRKDPVNADAFNYLGYSHRKLGQPEQAKTYYLKALEIDPEHKGANEYIGELYLELDDLAAAEERLEVLDDACGLFGCEEYDELKERIGANKTAKGAS